MIKKGILWVLILYLSVQIFSFSGATAEKSAGTSEKIAKTVVEVVKKTRSVPKNEEQSLFEKCHRFIRKTAHFTEFAFLGFLVYWLSKSYRLKHRFCFLISAGYGLAFAISDEIHQLFVPGRSGQVTDVLLDFCGVLFGIAVFAGVYRCKSLLKKRFAKS